MSATRAPFIPQDPPPPEGAVRDRHAYLSPDDTLWTEESVLDLDIYVYLHEKLNISPEDIQELSRQTNIVTSMREQWRYAQKEMDRLGKLLVLLQNKLPHHWHPGRIICQKVFTQLSLRLIQNNPELYKKIQDKYSLMEILP